ERFLWLAFWNQRALVNSVRELPDGGCLVAEDKPQHLQRHRRDVANLHEASGIKPHAGFGADAWQPLGWKRVKECRFTSCWNFVKGSRFVEFRCNGADELVRSDALTDRDFELLGDGLTNCQRDFNGRFPHAGQ